MGPEEISSEILGQFLQNMQHLSRISLESPLIFSASSSNSDTESSYSDEDNSIFSLLKNCTHLKYLHFKAEGEERAVWNTSIQQALPLLQEIQIDMPLSKRRHKENFAYQLEALIPSSITMTTFYHANARRLDL